MTTTDSTITTTTTVKWHHHEEWARDGKNFRITIKHVLGEIIPSLELGPNRWMVYAYIYPGHPRFDRILSENTWDEEGVDGLPLHRGCTYNKWHLNAEGVITSKQIGADYNHYMDESFSYYSILEEAVAVVYDAKKLFDVLSEEIKS